MRKGGVLLMVGALCACLVSGVFAQDGDVEVTTTTSTSTNTIFVDEPILVRNRLYRTQVIAVQGNTTVFNQTVDSPPDLDAALALFAQARASVASPSRPELVSSNVERTVNVTNTETGRREEVVVTTTTVVGPAQIFVGVNQTQPFFVREGTVNINSNTHTNITINRDVTTTTNITKVSLYRIRGNS